LYNLLTVARLGIFGGTFDPPHLGHAALATAAQVQLALDQVLWLVAADPPHKRGQVHTPARVRAEMVQAAVAGLPGHRLSRVDLDRPGPHYTVDALQLLAQQTPGAELYFLIGGDSLRDFPTWRAPETILTLAWLGVLQRPRVDPDLDRLEAQVPGLAARVRWVTVPPITTSSRAIRAAVQAGEVASLVGQVAAPVMAVIAREQLYRV
jgi:nicotinate-nucleotide adenylyltransferase